MVKQSEDGRKDILVVGPSWVGDMVMAQTLFKTLKHLQPEADIDVLAPAWSEPLLARMPQVRRSLVLPLGHGELRLGERRHQGKALAQAGYAAAYILPNSLKSALVPFFAGIPRRVGWRGEMRYGLLNDVRRLDKTRYPLMIERFAALAYPPGAELPGQLPWPELATDSGERRRAMAQFSLDKARPVLALCPGAEFGPSKRWPEEYYAEVAGRCIEDGWQVWLFGSGNDQAVTGAISQALAENLRPHCHDLAGKTRLAQAIDLLAESDCVVSNDSGLMHIAAALKRPLVVIYGSTSPGFTPPLAQQRAILSIPVPCGPCFERTCAVGDLRCQYGVTPEVVLGAIANLAGEPLQESDL